MSKLLHHWLTISLFILVGVPVLVVTSFLLLTLLPQLESYADAEYRAYTHAVSDRIDGFLLSKAERIEKIAKAIDHLPLSSVSIEHKLDAIIESDTILEALYLLDDTLHVVQIGIQDDDRPIRSNFIGLDFSGRAFVTTAKATMKTTWSDTFLSSSGEMSVAVAIPTRLGVLVGELSLRQLSAFVRAAGGNENIKAMIIDRLGGIIAHPDANIGIQNPRLDNNVLFASALAGKEASGEFDSEGVRYVGMATPIRDLGWIVLVVQPKSVAFAAHRTFLIALIAGSLFSLFVALGVALLLANALKKRFDAFNDHMHAIANGSYGGTIPRFRITEIDELSLSMQRMANSVLERESRLKQNEEKLSSILEGAADAIFIADQHGRYHYVNHSATTLLGYDRDQLLKMSIVDISRPEDLLDIKMHFKALLNKGVLRTEVWLKRKDNSCVEVEMSGTLLPDGSAFGSCRDITERKRAEDTLV